MYQQPKMISTVFCYDVSTEREASQTLNERPSPVTTQANFLISPPEEGRG